MNAPTAHRTAWAVLAWAVLLFVASVVPIHSIPIPSSELSIDKLMHGLLYIPLGLAACLAARERGSRRLPALFFGAAVSGVYGLGLEFVQAFLPWRSFEWMDAAFDLLGGGAGAGAATLAGILKTG